MSCNCLPQQSVSTSTNVNAGCICFSAYRKLCSTGPDPCDTNAFSIDVSDQVENNIGTSETYSIRSYDTSGLANVAITSAGVLTGDTTGGTGGEEYKILVDVTTTKDGRTYKITGEVYICLKDLCKGVTCPDGETCENCTGSCVAIGADLEI